MTKLKVKTVTGSKTNQSKNKNAILSRNPYSTTRIVDNVGILPSGMYRARKTVNGVKYSRNFTNLKKAKVWVNNL